MNAAQIINWCYEKFKPKKTMIHGYISAPISPTQKDMPSASSSIPMNDLLKYIKNGFPVDKFMVVGVQDTNSMEPYIDDNSWVLCERVTNAQDFQFRKGMICVYNGSGSNIRALHGKLVMHRITDIDNEQLHFKGDNNIGSDGWIDKKYVLYNVTGVIYGLQDEEGD